MKSLILYPLLYVMLSTSCGSTKDTPAAKSESVTAGSENSSTANSASTPPSTTTTTPPASTTTNASSDKMSDNYRLIVSFISIGEGIDSKARETMDSMINSWKEKKSNTLTVEKLPWGREGEVDYCFKLNELNAKDQDTFVAEVKSAFKENTLVQIAENQPSRHKR